MLTGVLYTHILLNTNCLLFICKSHLVISNSQWNTGVLVCCKWLTIIVVNTVITDELELHRAVLSVPALLTPTVPLAVLVGEACSVGPVPALIGTPSDGAVSAIVSCHAHARAILALAMYTAPVCGGNREMHDVVYRMIIYNTWRDARNQGL